MLIVLSRELTPMRVNPFDALLDDDENLDAALFGVSDGNSTSDRFYATHPVWKN
jgi:hypothetical protein